MKDDYKYHKLTELIWGKPIGKNTAMESDDRIIREYLSACAKELGDYLDLDQGVAGRVAIHFILGLGDVEAKSFWCNKHSVTGMGECGICKSETKLCTKHFGNVACACPFCSPKETPKQEWCEHIQMPVRDGKPTFNGGVIVYDEWKQCPICGTPRPIPILLSERLMRYLNDKHQCSISIRVATSAIEWMKSNV